MTKDLQYFRTHDRTIFFEEDTVPEVDSGFGYFYYNSSIHGLLVERVTDATGPELYTVVVSNDPDHPGSTAVLRRTGDFIHYRGANYRLKRF